MADVLTFNFINSDTNKVANQEAFVCTYIITNQVAYKSTNRAADKSTNHAADKSTNHEAD
eukprot:CCRYP_012650-RA/>CCRYP_012650-RA protein AED:0.28 eAED:1.00 QI:0/-1/0/1/-1/0/1/0/59